MFGCTAARTKLTARILIGLTIYPQIGFIREVKLGIMNSETYETREKYDCWCGGGA